MKMVQKEDRRIRRTKRLLLQGLTQLMAEKKINQINVTELTERADVNRSTFYLYYKDIFDMLAQVETEIFREFSATLEKYSRTAVTYDDSLAFFVYVFEFIKEHAELCKILLGPDGDYTFVEKFKKAIHEEQPPMGNFNDKIDCRYAMPFIVSGCIGVVQQWLEENMATPPKEMAAFVLEMITKGADRVPGQ